MNTNPRILAPIDFSPASDAALDLAVEIAARLGGTLVLFHAWSVPPFAGPDLLAYGATETRASIAQMLEESAKAAMNARLDSVRSRGATTAIAVVIEGEPVPAVLAEIARQRADMVVMGTHGRGFLAHAVMGSVAEKVVRLAPVPVLTVHAPKANTANREAA